MDFASGEKRSWLHGLGVRWFPIVGWAERGGGLADGHGNSVPRFHVTWGTGPAVVEPFEKKVRAAAKDGRVTFKFRHRDFELNAPVVIVTSGGIGANHDLVRRNWPDRLGSPPKFMVTGVPA